MEAENKLYVEMHGEGQGQPAPNPPLYTPTPQPQQGPTQGYPPYGPSAAAASPYYAPPSGVGYGGGYGGPYGVPLVQQQQQQVTVVVANQSPVVLAQPVQSFSCAKRYSCFVFWCCGLLFGLIAFILAVVATDKAATDAQGARRLGRASYIVSTVGIVVTITVVAIYFGAFYGRS